MQGNMPVKSDDKGFLYNGFQFYVGVYGDEFYTEAKLVVEAIKGGGQYGDPKVAGPTWKALAGKQIDAPQGDKLTATQREQFLQEFITTANTALAKWSAENGGGQVPEIPADFYGWLRWQFQNRVQFNSTTGKLVL